MKREILCRACQVENSTARSESAKKHKEFYIELFGACREECACDLCAEVIGVGDACYAASSGLRRDQYCSWEDAYIIRY